MYIIVHARLSRHGILPVEQFDHYDHELLDL